MNLAETAAEDRRIIILRALLEVSGSMNETVARAAVNNFGHQVGRDVVRADLQWLEAQRLVKLDKITTNGSDFWVVRITSDGDEVARGRPFAGVGRVFS